MISPYENLASAIIVKAADDYRKALKELRRNPDYRPALQTKSDCEHFFHSGWFSVLTAVDGNRLMRMLRAEVF